MTPRGFAGPNLLAMILFEKFGQHQPLNRQSERYAREGLVPGGTKRNRSYYGTWVHTPSLEDWQLDLLYDPQTAGGLLLSVNPDRVRDVERSFADAGELLYRIGEVVDGDAGTIEVN